MSQVDISKFPRILVIDDMLGTNKTYRESFCENNLLWDVTENDQEFITDEEINTIGINPIAKAFFFSGQKIVDNSLINDLEGIKKIILKGWEKYPRWALVLLDLKFKNEIYGLTVLENINDNSEFKDLPVILISDYERKEFDELKFSYLGVRGFLGKKKLNDKEEIKNVLFEQGLLEDNETIDKIYSRPKRIEKINNELNYRYIFGHSLELLKCLREARNRSKAKFKKGGDNILILGETGTGKELIATYIHKMSNREGELQTVFTEGINESLIEGEIFGWKKGAFTGANYEKKGAAELADKGTLFIDEFGEIPLRIQSKLLRLLDKNIRETKQIGSEKPVVPSPNIQVVLATNKFEILTSDSNFRADLLARINAYNPIIIPSLNDRKEDLPELVEHFIRKFEDLLGAQKREITKDALNRLLQNDWHSENVRGLERVLFNAIWRYKELRFLSANHLDLRNMVDFSQTKSPEIKNYNTDSIEYLLYVMKSFHFDSINPIEFKAIIPKIDKARAIMFSNLFKAAFDFMLSFDRREDTILPLNATAQILTGKEKMTSTEAKRLFSELFKISELANIDIRNDYLVNKLYNICAGKISNKVETNKSSKK